MALLTTQNPSSSGGTITMSAATSGAGDTFTNDGKTGLMVVNASGSSINVTLDSPGTCSFGLAANAAHDLVVAVPAGATKIIGPLDQLRFNDASNLITATFSAVTTVTVAAVRIA